VIHQVVLGVTLFARSHDNLPFCFTLCFSTTSSRPWNINYFLLYIVSLLHAWMEEVMGTIVEEVENQSEKPSSQFLYLIVMSH
jgi:hypothetical protein